MPKEYYEFLDHVDEPPQANEGTFGNPLSRSESSDEEKGEGKEKGNEGKQDLEALRRKTAG